MNENKAEMQKYINEIISLKNENESLRNRNLLLKNQVIQQQQQDKHLIELNKLEIKLKGEEEKKIQEIKKNEQLMREIEYQQKQNKELAEKFKDFQNYEKIVEFCKQLGLEDLLNTVIAYNEYFIPKSDYEIYKNNPLGSGQSCTVFPAKIKNELKYCAKILKKNSLQDLNKQFKYQMEEAQKYIANESEYIVKFHYFSVEKSDFLENGQFQIQVIFFLEKIQNSLHFLINDTQQLDFFKEMRNKLDIVQQILEGVNFLHSHNFSHGDLHSNNILVNWDGKNCQVKLADMGSSQYYEKFETQILPKTKHFFTLQRFLPPETCSDYQNFEYDKDQAYLSPRKFNIYQIGCTIYEIFSKQKAFPGCDQYSKLEAIYIQLKTSNFFELKRDYDNLLHKRLNIGNGSSHIEQIIIDCTKYQRADRPEIGNLLEKFKEIRTTFFN